MYVDEPKHCWSCQMAQAQECTTKYVLYMYRTSGFQVRGYKIQQDPMASLQNLGTFILTIYIKTVPLVKQESKDLPNSK